MKDKSTNVPFTDLSRFELSSDEKHIQYEVGGKQTGYDTLYQLQPGVLLRIMHFKYGDFDPTPQIESEKIIIEMNEKFFQSSESRKKITEQKIVQIKNDAIKDIKDASVKIAIESTSKIIQTSIDKSKLDAFFKRNLEQIKNSLKKTTRA